MVVVLVVVALTLSPSPLLLLLLLLLSQDHLTTALSDLHHATMERCQMIQGQARNKRDLRTARDLWVEAQTWLVREVVVVVVGTNI